MYIYHLNRHTYVEREAGESSNDRNDRAIREAVKWYNKHLQTSRQIQTLLLTNDADNSLRSILGIITTHVNHIGVEILISESCCASGYNVIEAWPWRVIGDVEVEGLWVSVRQGAAHWITIEIVDLSGVDDLIWGRILFDGDRVRKRLNKRWLKYRESQN